MLTLLGIATIAALLLLVLFRVTSVLVALTLVPVAAALVGGFAGSLGTFAMDGIRSVTPVAALLAFAVIYFGVMNDAGLFEPIIRALVRVVGTDPVRIALGTAAVASVAHLDGAGASTFMVTVPAMLPLYQRAAMSPLSLTCITALAAGTMNMLPWGGPTTRAATALQVGAAELFVPVIPAMLVGLVGVFVFALRVGRLERARLQSLPAFLDAEDAGERLPAATATLDVQPSRGSGRWLFNALLTAVTLAVLFTELMPLALVFMIASAIALVVNYPNSHEQRERLTSHGAAAMMMVTTIFAAGVFTGVLTKSGMLGAMTNDLVADSAECSTAAPAIDHGGGVDAAQPRVRSRLVLLRAAAGARQRLACGRRLGHRSRPRRGARPDDDRLPGQPADAGDFSAGRPGERRPGRPSAPHHPLCLRRDAAHDAGGAGDRGAEAMRTSNAGFRLRQGS